MRPGTCPRVTCVRVHGICRFYLQQFDERFELYCTPVQIDPDKPVMPVRSLSRGSVNSS